MQITTKLEVLTLDGAFWKYEYIVHACYVVLTNDVLSQLFRCEIHEVKGIDFLKGFASLLHSVRDEAGFAAVSAIIT